MNAENPPPGAVGFFSVRPAWAHTCGCKSRCELVTASKVKRNCVRATERGKEAWSVNREPMNKNRIEGGAEQGERAKNREALVTKARRRRCGGCAMKVCVLTWGDLASCLKGRRLCRSEKSAEVVVVGVAGLKKPEAKRRRTEAMGGQAPRLSEEKGLRCSRQRSSPEWWIG